MIGVHQEYAADEGVGSVCEDVQVDDLIVQLDTILEYVLKREHLYGAQVGGTDTLFKESARNLVHYLALRSFDLREVQEQLARLGLSSLGRTEAHVLASLQAVRHALYRLAGRTTEGFSADAVDFVDGQGLLSAHTEALFGRAPQDRAVRIMVTLPTEAADNYEMVREMMSAGMDCARINCAHDDRTAWANMARHVDRARRETGHSCRILMDLAGPKLRTGALEAGPQIRKYKPRRDERGRVVVPARVWLAPHLASVPKDASRYVTINVDESWLRGVQPGDRIRFRDARGKKRTLHVVHSTPEGCLAEGYETAYVESGTRLKLIPGDPGRSATTAPVGQLPAVDAYLLLKRGDTLILCRDQTPGRAAEDESAHARIPCSLPEVFSDVKPGDEVKFDDGKIEGVVRSVNIDELHVEIVRTDEEGAKLRADKSINFPDSTLRANGLTEKDLADLDFAAHNADIVGLSFVQSPEHVLRLQEELARRGGRPIGIMLKVETQRGFENLPAILMAAMRTHPVGVMIARGDLAVEVGWERMAEVQEEILWLCEAAHVPVVWATQVLETLAKKGLPSRSEITDAAMAERAECVMLNKGPHILLAIQMLDGILRRMQAHQLKKTAMLRILKVAEMAPHDSEPVESVLGGSGP